MVRTKGYIYGVIQFEGKTLYTEIKTDEDKECIFDQLRGQILEEL